MARGKKVFIGIDVHKESWQVTAISEGEDFLSLPLNRCRRLGGDVIDDAVDAADFVDDAIGNFRQQLRRKRDPVGGHTVLALHHAQGYDVLVAALVSRDTNGFDRQQNRKGLPDSNHSEYSREAP